MPPCIASNDHKTLDFVRLRNSASLDEGRIRHFLSLLTSSGHRHLGLLTTDLYAPLLEETDVLLLHVERRDGKYREDGRVAIDLGRLHRLSCVPSLETLIVNHWDYWGDSVLFASCDQLQNSKTSSMSNLQIEARGYPGIQLNEVLSWPKALKTFHFNAWPHRDAQNTPLSSLASRDFIEPLNYCRTTLEELHIRYDGGKAGAVLPSN